jgi:Xaa-Pro aminopeptidase
MLRKQARLEGAEDIRLLLAVAKEKKSLRPSENRRIEPGQVFILYFAIEYERYWAEGIKTFATGEASFSEIASDAKSVYYQAIALIRPGRTVSQVCRDLFDGARGSGLEPLSCYGLGNGIGLSLNESPVINERGGQKLKQGMCLAPRLAVHDKTLGNVMIGSTLLVGKNGVEEVT